MLRRPCGLLLLALVVSPFTAPFASYDLRDLLAGPASAADIVLQSKPGPDEPFGAFAGSPPVSVSTSTPANPGGHDRARTCFRVLDTPLRI